MSKLLIYIGEGQAFALEDAVQKIAALPGTSNARRGQFIGAVFECEYTFDGRSTIVRLSPDLETVTVEGLGPESAEFAVNLQKAMDRPLRVIDMNYSFDLALQDYSESSALMTAMSS